MDEMIVRLKTPEDCEHFAKNALERNRPDLAKDARKKAIELRAEAYGAKTQAERECLEAVYAYEVVLNAKNGRKTRASRIWQMITRHGILGAVELAVNHVTRTAGYYSALRDMGLQDYAFEAVMVRHPELFSPDTVQRSRKRVEKWNATNNSLWPPAPTPVAAPAPAPLMPPEVELGKDAAAPDTGALHNL